MKTAVVHDWLISFAGAEKVLEGILEVVPEPSLFTLIDKLDTNELSRLGVNCTNTSLLQNIPKVDRLYRYLLPFMPLVVEQFDLSEFQVIVSSSHAVAKGILKRADQLHICYCHTPVRYAWDLYFQYINSVPKPLRPLSALVLHYIRLWDLSSVSRVDHFVANSRYVAKRIWNTYRRRATVIYPPVDVDEFILNESPREDYYVCVSRNVPYKKLGVIVQAFGSMRDKRLIVLGKDTEKLSNPYPNISTLGAVSRDTLKEYLSNAKAFVYVAEEDFGISMVEAMACGTPVIAFSKGGSCEIVRDGKSGILFHEQTPAAIRDAVVRFEEVQNSMSREYIRKEAERFSKGRFLREFSDFLEKKTKAHLNRL